MSTQEERILNSGYRAQSAMYRSPCVSPRSGACARTPCDSWVKAKAKSKSISDNVGLGHNTSRQRESNTFSHFTSATAHHISWLSLGSVCASYTSNHLGAFLSRLNLVQKNKTSAAGPKKSIYHICTAQAAVAFSSRDAHPGGVIYTTRGLATPRGGLRPLWNNKLRFPSSNVPFVQRTGRLYRLPFWLWVVALCTIPANIAGDDGSESYQCPAACCAPVTKKPSAQRRPFGAWRGQPCTCLRNPSQASTSRPSLLGQHPRLQGMLISCQKEKEVLSKSIPILFGSHDSVCRC